MKKFIIFLTIVLVALIAFLIFLAVKPYIDIKRTETANLSNNIVQGNIIGVVQNETAVNEISPENITTTNNTSEGNEVSAAGNKEFETEVQNMTEEERNLYNIAFTVYAGNNISGQMCKALIEGVISSNANHIDVPGRFVAVTQNYTEEVDSTIGVPGNMDNSEEVVQDTNEMLYILRDNTDPDELYNVETVETSGIITEVKITKVE